MKKIEEIKNKIICGDALLELKKFPDNCVDTIITSPPYWGLRDYGIAGQIGLEKTLDEYIKKLLDITAELKRVLKPTGVMFWNHGDNYGGAISAPNAPKMGKRQHKPRKAIAIPKCLNLQNYRLIIQMINQGWILRNTVIWSKPNAMPSSVKDRFSNKYEPVFMLVKRKKYWFDLDAVRKPLTESAIERYGRGFGSPENKYLRQDPQKIGGAKIDLRPKELKGKDFRKTRDKNHLDFFRKKGSGGHYDYGGINDPKARKEIIKRMIIRGKNPGDVWEIPTQPFKEAHFATFPERLITPMILSSCPAKICKKCGKARVRIIKRDVGEPQPDIVDKKRLEGGVLKSGGKPTTSRSPSAFYKQAISTTRTTIGWTNCNCNAGWEAGIVLDPFIGSGTVGVVAKKLKRNSVGIELNPDYVKMAEKRIRATQEPLL